MGGVVLFLRKFIGVNLLQWIFALNQIHTLELSNQLIFAPKYIRTNGPSHQSAFAPMEFAPMDIRTNDLSQQIKFAP